MTKEVAIKKKESFWERNKKSNGLLLKKRAKSIAISMIRAILLFGMCFMILQPILNKISVSFMAEEDLYNAMVISIPEHFTTANYQLANQFMEYWSTLRNTLLVSFTIAILQIGVCTRFLITSVEMVLLLFHRRQYQHHCICISAFLIFLVFLRR